MADMATHKDLILEICVDSIDSAILAEQAGADRLELCSALDLGGMTPSAGMIALAKEKTKIPVFVLIRPRCGNFNYTDEEGRQIIRDIEYGLSLGADGFVVGALSEGNKELDKPLCTQIIEAANGLPVTFHRAFDLIKGDNEKALNEIVELGFQRLLTSGGCRSAVEGQQNIKRLVELADSRIIILPGAGLNNRNLKEFALNTQCSEFHSSGRLLRFKLEEDEMSVVAGADVYRSAQPYIIQSMRRTLNDVEFPAEL